MRGLPADNERVRAYEAGVDRLTKLGSGHKVPEDESRYVGRYGFDYPAYGDPEEFLANLTQECQEWVREEAAASPLAGVAVRQIKNACSPDAIAFNCTQ